MNWMDMSLRDFQAALASSSPTPGGGTAAAVALGQAASLSIMVSDLTLNNEKWKEGWAIAERVQQVAIPLLHRAGSLATEDSDAFDSVMESFKLPKNTEDETDLRRKTIRSATLHAAEVPFQTAQHALELLNLLPELALKGNSNAASDIGVAGLLASAAAKGAMFNVEINLDSLPEDHGGHLREAVPVMKDSMKKASREVMDAVRQRMAS